MLHIPQVLTPEELRTVRATIDAGTWIDGKRTAGTQAVQAKNNEQLSQTSEEARATQAVITRALNRNATFFSAALPKRLYPPQFNRYSGDSNHYGNHVDGAVMYVKGTGERVRSDVSCTLFLADPAD
ncbi:MAG TPA: PKHD-type hydroxylase, partial [Aquabacterium sp.]|nr:PKHD-type hydroxylase [Aquabacterium sp.]